MHAAWAPPQLHQPCAISTRFWLQHRAKRRRPRTARSDTERGPRGTPRQMRYPRRHCRLESFSRLCRRRDARPRAQTAAQQKATENAAINKEAATEIKRICSLPEEQRQADLKRLKDEKGVVISCGKMTLQRLTPATGPRSARSQARSASIVGSVIVAAPKHGGPALSERENCPR